MATLFCDSLMVDNTTSTKAVIFSKLNYLELKKQLYLVEVISTCTTHLEANDDITRT